MNLPDRLRAIAADNMQCSARMAGVAVEAASRIEGLESVLRLVHDWRGLCDDNEMETFERIASMFYQQTGYLRPGKDCRESSPEKRAEVWNKWVEGENLALDMKIRTALKERSNEE